MKRRSMLLRSLALAATFWSATGAVAQTFWQAGTGDWFTGSNWTLGVPVDPGDAVIANGGTAQIQAPGASVRRLRVGRIEGPGNLLVNGGTLNVTEDLILNETGANLANLTIQGGGLITSSATSLGVSSSGGISNATVTGVNSILNSHALTVGSGGVANLNISNDGTVYVANDLSINSQSTVNLNGGTLRFDTVSGTGGLSRVNYTSGTIQLAGDRDLNSDATITSLFGPLGTGKITIPAGKKLTVEGKAEVSQPPNFQSVTVNGGGLASTDMSIAPTLGGFLSVVNGGTVTTTGDVALAANATIGTVRLSGNGTSWTIGGKAIIGSDSGGSAELSISDQALVYVASELAINRSGDVTLDGGTLRFDTVSNDGMLTYVSGTVQLAGDRNVGLDSTISTLYGAFPAIPVGKGLTVEGTATLTKPLTIDGGAFTASSLAVGPGGSLGFDHGLLEIKGGGVTGISNLVIPANGELRSLGAQTAPVTAAAGSTITATGNLTLGDAAAVNGFYSDGVLSIGNHAVTLADANDAAFDTGALVTLGSGASPGTLSASNGLTLDFGGNITGFGTISSSNTLAKRSVINGNVTGASPAQPITMTGYVKGVGTFDNVNFTGTFSPGLSPTALAVGSIGLSPASTLVMELAGTTPGTGYDQILASGTLSLAGTLQIDLLGGFAPAVDQSFNLFDWSSLSGAFDALDLPVLENGLRWDTSQLYTSGVLSLVELNAAPPLRAGDADQDLDFDQFDLIQVLAAAKYLSGTPATWGEGDWNGAPGGEQGSPPPGDGRFDQRDIIAALRGGIYLTGPYAALADGGGEGDGQTSIGYDPSNGRVWVDAPAGMELTSVNVDSAAGIFTGTAAENLGGSFDNDADGNIFKATFGGSFGSITFGNVAQTGLAKDFVLNDLSVVGSLAGGGDLGNVDLIYVPEPGGVGLMLVGCVGIWLWRARQSVA